MEGSISLVIVVGVNAIRTGALSSPSLGGGIARNTNATTNSGNKHNPNDESTSSKVSLITGGVRE